MAKHRHQNAALERNIFFLWYLVLPLHEFRYHVEKQILFCNANTVNQEGSGIGVWGFEFKLVVPCCTSRFYVHDLLEYVNTRVPGFQTSIQSIINYILSRSHLSGA